MSAAQHPLAHFVAQKNLALIPVFHQLFEAVLP
jgi:hypothetical protein